MENGTNYTFESTRLITTLMKRPNKENQRKKTFSCSMVEFVDLVQGRYKTVAIHDSNNRLKIELTRDLLLARAIITPFVDHSSEMAFYLVNYSECDGE